MAFCVKCGKAVNDGAQFCADCGASTEVAVGASAVNNLAAGAQGSGVSGASSIDANKKKKFWIILAVVIGSLFVVFLAVAIPIFSKASAEAKMKEAPGIMASFGSAYLAALAEMGDDADIAKNDLISDFEDINSKWFKYEYLTYKQGGIAGLKATALSNIGNFSKGAFLQTTYQAGSETFAHCVGGNNADEAISVANEAIKSLSSFSQDFFSGKVALCSELPEQSTAHAPAQDGNTGSAQSAASASSVKVDSRLANLVPSGYQVFHEIKGDLNKDNFEDYVLMIQGKQNAERIGIIIVFNNDGNYEVVLENRNCLSFSYDTDEGGIESVVDNGALDIKTDGTSIHIEAFIKNGVLNIKQAFATCGVYCIEGSGDSYKFRYQNSDFEMIGYDSHSWMRDCASCEGNISDTSINLLGKKMQIKTNSGDEVWNEITIREPIKLRKIANFGKFNVMDYISKK